MAQQGRRTTLTERFEISQRVQTGQPDATIAEAMGLSRFTVRKWRRTAQRQGRAGLAPRLGRPPTGALGHFPESVQQAIRQRRQTHPGWGPLTLHLELAADPPVPHAPIPSRSRIAVFLKQERLTRRYERHVALPPPSDTSLQRAHQEWEMDAQGVIRLPSLGSVSLIHIGDRVSRLKVDSWPCVGTSKPTTGAYQQALRRAFLHYGLPERLSLDHDSVFYDNTSASPYPSVLHLWLIALGVEVRFIRKGRPTDHGFIERTHQLITHQAILGQDFAEVALLQNHLDDRLDFLNGRFPSSALGGQPPLVAHPEAHHSGRFYYPEWEESLLNPSRVYAYLAQGRWFRRVSAQGQCSLGAHRYGVGKAFARQTLEITFDPAAQEFVGLSEDGGQTLRFPAQGVTPADWMGDQSPWCALPTYQLSLPLPVAV